MHLTNFESITALRDIYDLCMQRSQQDRPNVKDILSLNILREQAKRFKINMFGASRVIEKTVAELVEEKRAVKMEVKQKKAAEKVLIAELEAQNAIKEQLDKR